MEHRRHEKVIYQETGFGTTSTYEDNKPKENLRT